MAWVLIRLPFFQLVSLTCDGLTGAVQDRMREEHHVQSHHMMFNMNLWSIGILAISKLHLCILITGGAFMQESRDGTVVRALASTTARPSIQGKRSCEI